MRISLPHEKRNNLGEGDNFSMITQTRDFTNFTKMVPLMHIYNKRVYFREGCGHLL
jgi:hypothetical protein